MTDILLGTLEDLARAKVGALIVVRGNDPLERHITGGIELGGRLSEPLLKSVFDPHSPGHDGAVIIERGRLSRFATHLPLSKDIEQLGQAGTRHCAALGLAELTDALCLVVSEERGKISYARGARIREVASLQEMGAQLQGFLKEKYPPPRRRKFSLQMLSQRWAEKLASLLLAVALWSVFIPGSKIDVVTYRIPVKVENLPPDLALNGVNPSEVSVTFTAPRRAFYIFDPGKLRVSIDASVAELGRRTFEISEKNVFYPKDFTLEALAPSTIRITVRKVSAEGRDGKKSAS
jgi:hypothetical protein